MYRIAYEAGYKAGEKFARQSKKDAVMPPFDIIRNMVDDYEQIQRNAESELQAWRNKYDWNKGVLRMITEEFPEFAQANTKRVDSEQSFFDFGYNFRVQLDKIADKLEDQWTQRQNEANEGGIHEDWQND